MKMWQFSPVDHVFRERNEQAGFLGRTWKVWPRAEEELLGWFGLAKCPGTRPEGDAGLNERKFARLRGHGIAVRHGRSAGPGRGVVDQQ